MNERDLRLAMDGCRPGHDDLELPELQELRQRLAADPSLRAAFARSQAFDRAVADAVHDVPVPRGLEQRLSAALAAARTETPPAELPGSETAAAGPTAPGIRRWKRGAAMLAVAASLLAAATLLPRMFLPPEIRLDEAFRAEVLAWTTSAAGREWTLDFRDDRVRRHPPDGELRAVPRAWTTFSTRYDSQTVAYRLDDPPAPPVLVFCLRCPQRGAGLSPSPPRIPFSTTGGVSVGAWRRGDLVYVLVVEGDPQRYRRFLAPASAIG